MEFNEIEEAVLNAISKAEQSGVKGIKQLLQPILDKCVAYRESIGGIAPGVLSKDPLNKPDWADSAPGFLNDDVSDEALLGELTPTNTEDLYMSPEELSKRREEDRTRWAETDFKAGSPEHLAYIEKQNPGTLEKWASNKMKEAAEHLRGSNEHFGEEQAEGLDNLLEGLRDTPHDNRW